MAGKFSAWCVVATETAFEAREMPYAMLSAPFVIAIHPGHQSAVDGANRALLMQESAEAEYAPLIERESQARAAAEPGSSAWAASVAHEIEIRNRIAASVREVAQPRKPA